VVRCIAGLAAFGLGIRMIIAADLGVAPWDVLHQGLSRHLGWGIGTWMILLGAVLVAINWVALAERPGVGTVLNTLVIGIVVDLIGDGLPQSDQFVPQLAMVAGGIVVTAVGSGLYIGAGLGAGPRDGLMLGLAARGVSVRFARTAIETAVLVSGVLLGGSVGVGTVLFALGIGPIVQALLPKLVMPPAP
jgi:uncharacterized membrane protein YczE